MFNSSFNVQSEETDGDVAVTVEVNQDATVHQVDFVTDSVAGYFTFEVMSRRGNALQPVNDSEGVPDQMSIADGILSVTIEGGLKAIRVTPTDMSIESVYTVKISSR